MSSRIDFEYLTWMVIAFLFIGYLFARVIAESQHESRCHSIGKAYHGSDLELNGYCKNQDNSLMRLY